MIRIRPLFLLCLMLTLCAGSVAARAELTGNPVRTQKSYSGRADIISGPVTGQVLDVVDGDTLAIAAKVWIGQRVETLVRIDGIDTPELKGKCAAEREKAIAAKNEIRRAIGTSGLVTLFDIRLEKYAGRVLARAATPNGLDLATHMIGKGLARPYHGERRQGWCGITAE